MERQGLSPLWGVKADPELHPRQLPVSGALRTLRNPEMREEFLASDPGQLGTISAGPAGYPFSTSLLPVEWVALLKPSTPKLSNMMTDDCEDPPWAHTL